jgi:carboxyl-terminal processing protease
MKRERLTKSIFLTLAILVVCLIFLSVGYYLGINRVSVNGSYSLVNINEGKSESIDFSAFWDLWDEVHKRYVNRNELNDRELIRGAMKGMVEAVGDPYSAFMPPNQSDIFDQDLEGSFGGVGIMIELVEGRLTVTSPLEDSPAKEAGIRSGDVIVEIDGGSVEKMSFDEMVSNIRGEIGTKVKLGVLRGNSGKKLEFEVVREEIVVESVEYEMLEGGIGYLRINQFGNDTLDLLDKASTFFNDNSAGSLVVDLRSNPGGFFDVCVKGVSKFIEDGVVVYQRDGENLDEFRAQGDASMGEYNLVVLVDEGSASAAEIMAGALRDQKGAKLVGEQTFGKGSVQDLKKIGSWGSLRITSGQWLTPKKELINGTGLKPDIEVKMDVSKIGSNNDKQLNRAIKMLKD